MLTAPHAHLLAAHHIPQPVTRHDHKLVVIVQNFLAQVRFRNDANPLDARSRKGAEGSIRGGLGETASNVG